MNELRKSEVSTFIFMIHFAKHQYEYVKYCVTDVIATQLSMCFGSESFNSLKCFSNV